jgi:hypothetical protein
MNQRIESLHSADVQENIIRQSMPKILDILLVDRTTSTPSKTKNIIWATNNYKKYGAQSYAATSEIKPELVTGIMGNVIIPRALKDRNMQLERTKSKAEVFTPLWIVKKQNDEVDKTYSSDDLETYVSRKWIEITCGEAPYMTSRYDMETGNLVLLKNRVGFIDRKLKRINKEIDDKAEWQRLVEVAYKSSYGFEWSGDSLLIARENLLYTYRDFYVEKWGKEPLYGLFEEIAKIISYNVFQMDGIKYIIPLSEKKERKLFIEISLFDDDEPEEEWTTKPGKRVRIMNWDTNKMEYFDKGI